ncbi:hypothetical protein EDF69_003186 [Sphingomonas sp. JUb134]|nr:hypothetical protein [Sphingomonas sp. JUb134]MBM7407620.1 hypothetical protein [Sphingomonas sp. JUb134]
MVPKGCRWPPQTSEVLAEPNAKKSRPDHGSDRLSLIQKRLAYIFTETPTYMKRPTLS